MARCRRPSIARKRDSAFGDDGNYHLAIGTAEFGNGTTTVHRQIVVARSQQHRRRACESSNADTDRTGYDTGAFASAGTVVAGNAVRLAAEALRERMLDFASKNYRVSRDACRLEHDAITYNDTQVFRWRNLPRPLASAGRPLEAVRKAYGTPRSVTFQVQGFRIAVNRVTGEIVDPAKRSWRRRRRDHQSDAMQGSDRRRDRAGARLGASGKNGLR